MITFTLDQVKDKFTIQDLIPVTIERVKNLHSEDYVSKFMIHVKDDTFGLFSEKYTYCNIKQLIKSLGNFKLVRYVYTNGNLTCYISEDKESIFDIDPETLKIMKLIDPEIEKLDSKVSNTLFIVNSYTGSRRLTLGQSLRFQSTKLDIFVKYSLSSLALSHLPLLKDMIEEQKLEFSPLDKIKSIDPNLLLESVKSVLGKQKSVQFMSFVNKLTNVNALHILLIVSIINVDVNKELKILEIVQKLIKE